MPHSFDEPAFSRDVSATEKMVLATALCVLKFFFHLASPNQYPYARIIYSAFAQNLVESCVDCCRAFYPCQLSLSLFRPKAQPESQTGRRDY